MLATKSSSDFFNRIHPSRNFGRSASGADDGLALTGQSRWRRTVDYYSWPPTVRPQDADVIPWAVAGAWVVPELSLTRRELGPLPQPNSHLSQVPLRQSVPARRRLPSRSHSPSGREQDTRVPVFAWHAPLMSAERARARKAPGAGRPRTFSWADATPRRGAAFFVDDLAILLSGTGRAVPGLR